MSLIWKWKNTICAAFIRKIETWKHRLFLVISFIKKSILMVLFGVLVYVNINVKNQFSPGVPVLATIGLSHSFEAQQRERLMDQKIFDEWNRKIILYRQLGDFRIYPNTDVLNKITGFEKDFEMNPNTSLFFLVLLIARNCQ